MLNIDNVLNFLFYLFAIVLIFASIRVVTVKNPVHAALFLILSFFTASALWILLNAEFLAITLVLVYVGAVMVLFLFVIMMAKLDIENLRKGFWSNLSVALPVGLLIIFEMSTVLIYSFSNIKQEASFQISSSNTYQLGMRIYTEYFYPFQIAAVLLLLAMIAAIALTLRSRKDVRGQNPSEQVKVNPKERVSLVNLNTKNSEISKD